jgi:hypothetical protein
LRKEFLAAGFKEDDLIPVSLGLNVANKSSIKIDGAILVRLDVKVGGKDHTCATMVYISPSCEGFFMSLEAMLDLDLFQTFNTPASASEACNMLTEECSKQDTTADESPSSHPSVSSDQPCTCPSRTMPKRPDKLPFPAIPENNAKMELWLREYFVLSTFNIYPDKELPEMSGPPVEIHLKWMELSHKA